ncbi:Predicted 3-hydroxylacyl-ACP dehydratase, HotDog domain [Aeromonas sp. RU39B]|uniref:ApeP family dehydratase n=1 Tax=Aeromonas sp. RU39B TaxID=1907416 RepID=UPI00095705FD|nr:hotdog family protein [Aeromonas sp. RU39B]SIQ36630.1 Predicted 3-hydroxylacyl-ACP dehydratase, HotDog domain [Aeromonas sp. RU39B]
MNYPAIETLVPHRAPMLLLERVVDSGEQWICCDTVVGPRQGLLLDAQGNLPGWCGIELMAQTIAAWAGLQGHARGEPARIGMLLGARKYDSQRPVFAAGERLLIEARCLLQDGGMASFECVIRQEGQECARARLSTYQPDESQLSDLLKAE